MIRWKTNKYVCVLVLFALGLSACHSSSQKKKVAKAREHVVTVEKKTSITRLFYSGYIQPIKVNTVISPVEGKISQINFGYGQIVDKDQWLVKIRSDKLQNEFHGAVSAYLKNKEAYSNSRANFKGSSELYKEKIISRQEFTQERTRLENNEIAYLDSKFKLSQLVQSVPSLGKKIQNINFDDMKNIRKIFDQKFDEITLHSGRKGIVLFPVKKAKSESVDRELEAGNEVKKGQGLLSVGDLSSLGVVFDVGEMEINKLNPGQLVKVTSPAIANVVLTGTVYSVAVQSKSSQNYNDNAKFPVKVKVDHISEVLQKRLRVGMSVQVEVDIAQDSEIIVPLSAVKNHHGVAQVKEVDPKTKKARWKNVETGNTTIRSVQVLGGLKAGEHIIVNDQS